MISQVAHDFIYKGVGHLENKGARFQLRKAVDVARVIITTANGWDARKKEITHTLAEKGITTVTKELKLQSQMLVDDFIENSVVVCIHNSHESYVNKLFLGFHGHLRRF